MANERYLCNQARKELTDSWFLTGSIWPSVFFVTVYLLFVYRIGPRFMKNRTAFNLKPIILVFNLSQFLTNAYMWTRALSVDGGIEYLIENSCHPSDQVNSSFCQQESFLIWLYYVTKLEDLLDTVFFILKKKQSQVTFLHIYHHSCMVFVAWYFGQSLSGSQTLITGGINAVIHTIMYAYYFLSALGPGVQKYLWWKIYLTRLQMVQFIFILTYMIYLIVNQCALPESMSYILIFLEVTFIALFLNFYFQSYVLPKKKPE